MSETYICQSHSSFGDKGSVELDHPVGGGGTDVGCIITTLWERIKQSTPVLYTPMMH